MWILPIIVFRGKKRLVSRINHYCISQTVMNSANMIKSPEMIQWSPHSKLEHQLLYTDRGPVEWFAAGLLFNRGFIHRQSAPPYIQQPGGVWQPALKPPLLVLCARSSSWLDAATCLQTSVSCIAPRPSPWRDSSSTAWSSSVTRGRCSLRYSLIFYIHSLVTLSCPLS